MGSAQERRDTGKFGHAVGETQFADVTQKIAGVFPIHVLGEGNADVRTLPMDS